MAGKTIQESKDACHKDCKNGKGNNTTKPYNINEKITINIKDSTGKAFIINPCNISTPNNNIKTEFAGLASDPPESILPDSMENIKWNSF